MDEQTDHQFQLKKARARQRALRESISQELELYRQEIAENPDEETVEKEDLRKKIVDTRVLIEDARQRISYNLDRLATEFKLELNFKEYVVSHPKQSIGFAVALGFYFGLRK